MKSVSININSSKKVNKKTENKNTILRENNQNNENNNVILRENNNNNEKEIKKRTKIKNFELSLDLSNNKNNNIIENLRDYNNQIIFINKLYLNEDFEGKKFLISELKSKINSYKQQDIKKYIHEDIINLENVIEKLVTCKLKCYYCKKNMLIFFTKVRDNDQWTLDRINNFDEHNNENTIVCCLGCNLQRRRKNSDKFLFTKQLETNQIKIKKTT